MADAVMRIQVAGVPDVPDGESRNDAVAGAVVTLTSVGLGNTGHAMVLISAENDGTTVALTQNTATEWEFTPAPDGNLGAAYLIELTCTDAGANTDTIRRVVRVPYRNALVPPARLEGCHPDASFANSGAVYIKASDDNADDNHEGYAPRLVDWFNTVSRLFHDSYGPFIGQTTNDTEAAIGVVDAWSALTGTVQGEHWEFWALATQNATPKLYYAEGYSAALWTSGGTAALPAGETGTNKDKEYQYPVAGSEAESIRTRFGVGVINADRAEVLCRGGASDGTLTWEVYMFRRRLQT